MPPPPYYRAILVRRALAVARLSGGQPLTVFGEWNGGQFWPLSAWRGERVTAF